MIEVLEVELASPAMIGGAIQGKCDSPHSLRVPELRGLFRFWTRALGGGRFRELEEQLWGSTRLGQRVSLRSIPIGGVEPPLQPGPPGSQDPFLFPHKLRGKQTPAQMIKSGVKFELRFAIPRFGSTLGDQLRAVVWAAIHLGAVGRRSRRGYGSLQWLPRAGGDLLSDFVPNGFDPNRDLSSDTALANYIRRGLTKALAVCGTAPPPASRLSSDWFQLRTTDQVFVGSPHTETYNSAPAGMEFIIHGLGPYRNRSSNDDEKQQLGRALPAEGGRLASPMLWHVYRLTTGAYVPVLTWSPRSGVTSLTAPSRMYDYLTSTLGFGNSLAGNAL